MSRLTHYPDELQGLDRQLEEQCYVDAMQA
jgi:hypothetical protein